MKATNKQLEKAQQLFFAEYNWLANELFLNNKKQAAEFNDLFTNVILTYAANGYAEKKELEKLYVLWMVFYEMKQRLLR